MAMSTMHLRPHKTYYTNFFVLRTAVTINEQAAEICFTENKELNFSCQYPNTKYLSLTTPKWEEVLSKYGVSHISNFWYADVPFFPVSFFSEVNIEKFIKSQQRMENEVAAGMAAALSASECAENMRCVVETELFLVVPDVERKEARFTKVTCDNYSSCLEVWKESEVFEFESTFRSYLTSPRQSTAVTEGLSSKLLISELSDIVDWFTFGVYLGVPTSDLLRIERDRQFTMERLVLMLDWWVKNGEQPTDQWSAVVRALFGIRMRGLAKKIAEKYKVALPTDSERRTLEALPLQTEAKHSNASLEARLKKLRDEMRSEELEHVLKSLKEERQEKIDLERKLSNSNKELTSAHKEISSLSMEKMEAERMLRLSNDELKLLQDGDESNRDLIESKEADIAQLKERLNSAERDLRQAREKAEHLKEKLQQTTVELAKRSTQVCEMERDRADLERERSRADMMMMHLCAMSQRVQSPLEKVIPAELDDIKQSIEGKAEEVARLSSQLKAKTEMQKLLTQRQSQEEKDELVEVTMKVCKLKTSLMEAEEGKMRAVIELEDLNSKKNIFNETQVDSVVEAFKITKDEMEDIAKRLTECMKKGLESLRDKEVVKMLPTYVHSLPDGSEEGDFLAVDFGGSKFKIMLITFKGGKITDRIEKKCEMQSALKESTGEELFDFIAKCISEFVTQHNITKKLPLAFTFSFPVLQTSLTSGILLRWTKGFNVSGVVGKDVVKPLREALQRKDVNVDVVALVSDTTGTQMAIGLQQKAIGLQYSNCHVGLLVGTGFNACYMEKLDQVKKLSGDRSKHPTMIINCEFGALGDRQELKPWLTEFDRELNTQSLHPGQQTFEKMTARMYVGEIARLVLLKLIQKQVLFGGKSLYKFSKVDAFGTEYFINIEGGDNAKCKKIFKDNFGIDATDTDCEVVRRVCKAVTRRSARLAGTAVVALVRKINKTNGCTVAVDGSLFKLHPNFLSKMKKAINELHPGNHIVMQVSTDGSGGGAAAVAAMATRLIAAGH